MKKDKFKIQQSAFDELANKRKIAICVGALCIISTVAYFLYRNNKSIKVK
jgi:hypothetical protein